ncbi:MAG: nuclear transport factor 2 family protein [Candidatus Latescibacterota bacterium]
MTNVERVQQIYAAFGRGDIPAILAHLADGVEWEYGVNSTSVPWLQPRRGRTAVPLFFEALGGLEIRVFQPTCILDGGSVVVCLVDAEFTVKATGAAIVEEDEVHVWHFDPQGRVTRFRHRVDTHQHWAAYTGQPSR